MKTIDWFRDGMFAALCTLLGILSTSVYYKLTYTPVVKVAPTPTPAYREATNAYAFMTSDGVVCSGLGVTFSCNTYPEPTKYGTFADGPARSDQYACLVIGPPVRRYQICSGTGASLGEWFPKVRQEWLANYHIEETAAVPHITGVTDEAHGGTRTP